MEKETRNKIKKMVQAARSLLEHEIQDQLEGVYGLRKDGTIEDISYLPQIKDDSRALKAREGFKYFIHNEKAQGVTEEDSVKTLVLSLSFTHLNRLIALKLMERRKVIKESISRKTNSNGFKFFLADFPEEEERFRCGQVDEAYKNFILHQYGRISEEIHVLFDPDDISNLVFPRPRALYELLNLINRDSLAEIWEEDETIGWIYQYFTPKELREKARKESAAPRNSYELAFRNQFYTPKYVVKFLTDNTLGRTWYEMCRGDTKLADLCEYMVRRPNEVFLEEGEEPPETGEDASKTQEELSKEPFYIPYRAKKDPREIRVLDPAVGSGHFLLYCFDLLQIIYEEAYDDPDIGHSLKKEYPSFEEYGKAIPGLILRHNLHGIDIDLRATQIASLALWLRAQRAYQEIGLKADERPKITKSNIACAEPMPGDEEMLEAFKKNLGDAVLGELVSDVWKEMKLAGEAGSLLKIEERIPEVVKEAKEEWLTRSKTTQSDLSGEKIISEQLRFDFSGIKGDMFWGEAEERLWEALERFAEEVSNGGAYSHRLFAEDAARGFAFIDVMQKKYDVVLMNPPFGEASEKTRHIFQREYPEWNKNLLCAFLHRMLDLTTQDGSLGIIFDRTAVVKSTYEKFRKNILIGRNAIFCMGDTGWEVLEANVETTTMVFQKSLAPIKHHPAFFFDVRNIPIGEKGAGLSEKVGAFRQGKKEEGVYLANPDDFEKLPNLVIGYDIPTFIRKIFVNNRALEKSIGLAGRGGEIKSEVFFRDFWEVNSKDITINGRWCLLYNGGNYSFFYSPTYQVIFWSKRADTYENIPKNAVWHKERLYLDSLCYGKRGDFIDVHKSRGNHVFTVEGFWLDIQKDYEWFALSILNSSLLQTIINYYSGQHKQSGYINLIPIKENPDCFIKRILSNLSRQGYHLKSSWYLGDETNYQFENPWIIAWLEKDKEYKGINGILDALIAYGQEADNELERISTEIDNRTLELYEVTDPEDIAVVEKAVERRPKDVLWKETRGYSEGKKKLYHVESLLSFWVGCLFGRWDAVNGSFYDEQLVQNGEIFDLREVIRKKADELWGKDEIIAEPTKFALSKEEIKAAPKVKYPYVIDSDGIIPLDEGHPEDLVKRIMGAISITFGESKSHEIAKEIEEIIGTKLRKYLEKKFFSSHINRYLKRPIYWQLSTRNKNYSLWFYYHRLTPDIIFLALRNYIDPKVEYEATKMREIEDKLESGKESLPRSQITKLEKEIERQADFLLEIKEFRETLEKIARSGYNPDFDDGVILNMAPLHELIPWNEPAKYQKDLEAGKYDWAHIAMKYWHERVEEKCKKDKSLAIAHGLEELYDGNSN